MPAHGSLAPVLCCEASVATCAQMSPSIHLKIKLEGAARLNNPDQMADFALSSLCSPRPSRGREGTIF